MSLLAPPDRYPGYSAVSTYAHTHTSLILPSSSISPSLDLSPTRQPFGEDHEVQYIYKEPNVTALAEFTLRLKDLYSRKFGSADIVHIVHESGKVGMSLDYHVTPPSIYIPYSVSCV